MRTNQNAFAKQQQQQPEEKSREKKIEEKNNAQFDEATQEAKE